MSTDSNPSYDNKQARKTCSGCGKSYPLTFEFWYHQSSSKDGFKTQCRQCVNAHGAKWAERNRDKHLENRRNWNKNNPDKVKSYRRNDYEKHKEKRIERNRRWVAENPQRVRVIKRRYSEKKRKTERKFNQMQLWTMRLCHHCNKEYPATDQFWYRRTKKFPNICKACYDKLDYGTLLRRRLTVYQQRRRIRQLNAEGSHTLEEIDALYIQQQGRCFHCDTEFNGKYTEDHWIPLSRGGSDYISNIRLLCGKCNSRKKDKLPHEWHPEKYPPPK